MQQDEQNAQHDLQNAQDKQNAQDMQDTPQNVLGANSANGKPDDAIPEDEGDEVGGCSALDGMWDEEGEPHRADEDDETPHAEEADEGLVLVSMLIFDLESLAL